MKDLEKLRQAAQAYEEELLRNKSPEELARLLAPLTLEQRLAGLSPEEIDHLRAYLKQMLAASAHKPAA